MKDVSNDKEEYKTKNNLLESSLSKPFYTSG